MKIRSMRGVGCLLAIVMTGCSASSTDDGSAEGAGESQELRTSNDAQAVTIEDLLEGVTKITSERMVSLLPSESLVTIEGEKVNEVVAAVTAIEQTVRPGEPTHCFTDGWSLSFYADSSRLMSLSMCTMFYFGNGVIKADIYGPGDGNHLGSIKVRADDVIALTRNEPRR